MKQFARKQAGYFLVLAVLLIMVIGLLGVAVAHMYTARAKISAAQQQGLQALYIAESGLDVAARLLVGSNLVSGQGVTCNTLTGNSLLTNAAMLDGSFTATAIGGGLYSASTTTVGSITTSSNSVTLASVTGLAPHGRIRIGSEIINYASISGNTLIGLSRGAGGSTASSHATGAAVSQSVCLVNVKSGIPSIASPKYQRELEIAVEIIDGSDIWAVGNRQGNRFTIIRWDHPTPNVWNDYSFSDNTNRENLRSVSFSSANYGWAVGDQRGSNFTMLAWNGSSWSVAPLAGACNNQDLYGVKVTSPNEAWAVGLRARPNCVNNGTYRYTILKWNGSSWTELTPSTSPSIPADASNNRDLNALDILDTNGDGYADLAFAVGDNGTILRYTGSSWVASSSGTGNNLLGVSVVSASEAWAVGNNGTIIRWNGSTWSGVSSPTSTRLNAVHMTDTNGTGYANYGWAVGNNGRIIYYNGSTWSTQSSSTSRALYGIADVSSSEAWAVGANDTTVRWQGSSWATESTPVPGNPAMRSVAVVPGSGASGGTLAGSWEQVYN